MSRVNFKSKCPACKGSRICYWTHYNCGCHQEVDEDGEVYCNNVKCGQLGKLWDLQYRCRDHYDSGFLAVDDNERLKLVLTEIGSIPGGLKFARNLLTAAINSGRFD